MIEYQAQFFKKLKVLDLYLVKFYNDSFIEEKAYFSDCTVIGSNKRLVIFNIYNESTFLVNNS